MRTGTVASTDNRNWELLPDNTPQRRFSQSRAVALDMESATIAANGFRFRVPYGTLLCVSDKPLHGEIKLPGMANHFYRERVDQHLRIGMRAIDILREGACSACTAASCAALPKWRFSSGPAAQSLLF
jgi:AMP nucleosidase